MKFLVGREGCIEEAAVQLAASAHLRLLCVLNEAPHKHGHCGCTTKGTGSRDEMTAVTGVTSTDMRTTYRHLQMARYMMASVMAGGFLRRAATSRV